jgi:hypothetical protein
MFFDARDEYNLDDAPHRNRCGHTILGEGQTADVHVVDACTPLNHTTNADPRSNPIVEKPSGWAQAKDNGTVVELLWHTPGAYTFSDFFPRAWDILRR